MPNVDITFLLLSSPPSESAIEILRLSELAIDSGFHAKVSTNPVELAKVRAPGRHSIVIIDGLRSGDYDAYALASILRCMRGIGIIMLLGNDSAARSRALRAGADLSLSYPVDAEEFHCAVSAVARRCKFEPGDRDENDSQNFTSAYAAGPIEDPSEAHRIGAALTSESEPPAPATWLLTARRWALRSPDGITISLTASERTLMSSLFAAQRSVVSHEDLLALQGYANDTGEGQRRPLSAIVSRLKKMRRRRGAAADFFAQEQGLSV